MSDTAGPGDARALLARTPLLVRRGPFVLAAWGPAQISAVCQGLLRCRTAHGFVILDELEASALLPEGALIDMPPARHVQRGFALITLGQPMEWNVTGVLAAVSSALADAGVPLGAAAAFSRDHLFVPLDRLDDAIAALAPLCAEVRVLA